MIIRDAFTQPAAWTAATAQHDPAWQQVLSSETLAVLEHALAALTSRGPAFPHFGKADFPIEALDLSDAIMMDPAMRVDMMLEAGDLQLANHYAVLHSRTAFEDPEDLRLRRKMLRLWVKMPNARQLAPEFPGRNGFPDPVAA